MALLQPLLVYLCIIAQIFLCGFSLVQKFKFFDSFTDISKNIWLKVFFGLVVGLGINITILFILGTLGLLTPLLSALSLIAITCFVYGLNSFRIHLFFKNIDKFLLLPLTVLFIALTLYSIHPTGRWDDTMYHLPEAKLYAENHKIIFQPFLRYPLFPQNMSLVFSMGFMFGGNQIGHEILAQLLATLPIFISTIGLMGVFAWLCNAPYLGILAGVWLLRIKFVRYALGYAYIDNAAMMFSLSSLIATALFLTYYRRQKLPLSWIFLIGALIGLGIGTKYFSGYIALYIGFAMLLYARRLKFLIVYTLSILCFGTWWSIRAWIISGDPLHPFGAKIFGKFLWDEGDYTYQKWQIANESMPKTFSGILASLNYEGFLSLLLFPLSILFWKKFTLGIKFLFLSTFAYLCFWYILTPVPRFLLPISSVIVFFNILFLCQIFQLIKENRKFNVSNFFNTISHKFSLLIVCLMTLTPTIYLLIKSQKTVKLKKWEQVQNSRPFYTIMQSANLLSDEFGSRMLGVGCQFSVYYYNGLLIGVDFGPGRTRQMIQCLPDKPKCEVISPFEMQQLMKKFNTNLLVINTTILDVNMKEYNKFFSVHSMTEDAVLFTRRVKH